MFLIIFKLIRRVVTFLNNLKFILKLYFYRKVYNSRLHLGNKIHLHKDFCFTLDSSASSISIGDNLVARNNFIIRSCNNGNIEIGTNVFFNSYCSINGMSKIIIGNNCQFGEGVRIYDHDHKYKAVNENISKQGYTYGHVIIGNNCWISSNVIILKGVEIGDNVVVGAGCILHKSVPSNTLVVNHQNLLYNSY